MSQPKRTRNPFRGLGPAPATAPTPPPAAPLREIVMPGLGRITAAARQLLCKLLDGRLIMTPKVTPEGRFYEYAGPTSYGKLLGGLVSVKGLVAPG